MHQLQHRTSPAAPPLPAAAAAPRSAAAAAPRSAPSTPNRWCRQQRHCQQARCSTQQQIQQQLEQQQQQPRRLDHVSGPGVLQQLDTLVFDQDGVLWRGNELVPNAVEALHVFRQAGKRLLFVTNNSSKSREEYAAKFAALGFQVPASEIVASSYCAAAYLHSIRYRQAREAAGQPPGVLLLGSRGMRAELEGVGLQVLDVHDDLRLPLQDSVDAMLALELDPRIGAVVVGWDPRFDYSTLVYVTALLRERGCLFVATNLDHADAIGGAAAAAADSSSQGNGSSSSSSSNGRVEGAAAAGRVMPGTGAIVAAITTASGVTPVNVGKGGAWLFDHLRDAYALDPATAAIIGDRLDTDIATGKQGGLVTMLPLTGITTLEQAMAAAPADAPDYVLGSVADLAGLPSAGSC